jgi:glycosyltransferase involved in cell wall biosynthesis
MKYVLITPAHNEETLIQKTLASMVAQTVFPERWVIVDDGSTDCTTEIVESYAKRHPWIELVRRPQRSDRNFAAKARAVSAGFERVQPLKVELIGNVQHSTSTVRSNGPLTRL